MGLVINSSSYAGELALPYIAPAILAADSIANGYITLKENVKYQAVLKSLSGGTIAPATCNFTDGGEESLALDEVILSVTNLMVNEQICKADFRSDWEALQTGKGFINDQLPPNFETFLLQYLAARVAESIERNMWHGNYNETTGGTTGGNAVTAFTGILAHIVAGAPTAETLVAGTFTPDAQATGILTHLNTLVNNAPFTIQNNSNSVIMMSKRSLFLLQRAMAGLLTTSGAYSPTFVGENRPTTFLGFPIVTPAGFPNDTLVMSYVGNLFFGTDLTSDYNQAVVVDMTQTDASDNVRIAMRFTGGTQVAHINDLSVVRRSS